MSVRGILLLLFSGGGGGGGGGGGRRYDGREGSRRLPKLVLQV